MARLAAIDRDLLLKSPVLKLVPEGRRAQTVQSAEIAVHPAGGTIMSPSSVSDRVFVVLEGRVAFTIEDRRGERVVLARLERGGSFGEQGAFEDAGDLRTATVVAETDVVCASIARKALRTETVETGPTAGARTVLADSSLTDLRSEIVASMNVLAEVDVRGDGRGISESTARPGEEIVAQGEQADAVYFVIEGIVLVVEHNDGASTELSRIGPGQCFGELGVVRGQPRSASAIAETPVRLLRVEADEFLDWHRRHPHLRELLTTLERAYRIRDGRLLLVYRGDVAGEPTITTVQGDPAGECVISTNVVGREVVLFARRPAPEAFEAVDFTSPDGTAQRVLHVEEDGGRAADGSTARLVGVTARGLGPDLAHLYRAVTDGASLGKRELNVFRITGHLGTARGRAEEGLLCGCLRISGDDIEMLDEGLADSFASVSKALGVGLVCGGCENVVSDFIAGRGPSADPDAATPEPTIVRLEPELEFDEEMLRDLRGTVELQLAAAASANSNPGERFLVATLVEAIPRIDDHRLRVDVEVFLEQEANHIYWHSQLNNILNEVVFPDAPALDRARRRPLSSLGRFGLGTRLAVCAASEHAADVFFAGLFERYYSADSTIHEDLDVDSRMRESGAGELFAWHGREELEHRHVAFDVMAALGTPYRARVLGFTLLVASLIRHQVPALLAMRRSAGPPWRPYLRTIRRLGRGVVPRVFEFLRPGFHPAEREYGFMDQLRADTAHLRSG